MKTFKQFVAEAAPRPSRLKPGTLAHFEHHAGKYHHYLDKIENADGEVKEDHYNDLASKHSNEVEKHYGRKMADELNHTDNSPQARARTFKNH